MKYVLAPLAGFTDAPFRLMATEGGADLTYTEMVSAAGLAHGSSPTHHLMEVLPSEGPVACQLFGAKETDIAYATREIENLNLQSSTLNHQPRFCELNLNAGCPMTKVMREGAGAKLVEDPAKVYRLLKAMVENTSLPVTLKTRLGPHPQKTQVFELLDAAERAGVQGFIVHARYTSQMHGGTVHLETLSELVCRAHVPVTGNGSVTDAKTAAAMAETGVAAIMIGRAALSDSKIFARLKGTAAPVRVPSPEEAAAVCRRHLGYVLDFQSLLAARYPHDHIPGPDGFASVRMHTHLFRYFNGLPGAATLRARLNTVRTCAEIESAIDAVGARITNL